MKTITEYAVFQKYTKDDILFQTCVVVLRRHTNMNKKERQYFYGIANPMRETCSHHYALYKMIVRYNNANLAILMESMGHIHLAFAIRRLSRLNKIKLVPTTKRIEASDLAKKANELLKKKQFINAIKHYRLAAELAQKQGYTQAAQFLYRKADSLLTRNAKPKTKVKNNQKIKVVAEKKIKADATPITKTEAQPIVYSEEFRKLCPTSYAELTGKSQVKADVTYNYRYSYLDSRKRKQTKWHKASTNRIETVANAIKASMKKPYRLKVCLLGKNNRILVTYHT